MDISQPAATPEPEPPPDRAVGASDEPAGNALREAMLHAIGELSDTERERLSAANQPDALANAWRDLIAERAAREREATVRHELAREAEAQSLADRQRPTAGLQGGPPLALPTSVTDWTDFIRSSDGQSQMQQRRAQFANWLAAHPEA